MDTPRSRKRGGEESWLTPLKRRCTPIEKRNSFNAQSFSSERECSDISDNFRLNVDALTDTMFKKERNFMLPSSPVEELKNIDGQMRKLLINGLVQLHTHFQLTCTSLFLTVSCLDRYLAHVAVAKSDLPLVGLTSMLAASKLVEVQPPQVRELLHLNASSCSPSEITNIECSLLTALDFRLACPTADQFLQRLHEQNDSDEVQRNMASYIIELTLLETRFLHFLPSQLAAAAMLLSNTVSRRPADWPEEMSSMSRYPRSALQDCVNCMISCAAAAPGDHMQAVCDRYRSTRHYSKWSAKIKEFQQAQNRSASPRKLKPTGALKSKPAGSPSKSKPASKSPQCTAASLCKRRGCPEQRIAVHQQAFEGLLRKSAKDLKSMCKARRVPCSGNKEELATRLLDSMFH
eukprot:TRINITY_DN91129_c0_g1_i1.p1 TRINITY_DN91129_c0_g1~~TRINITY_DN91129_c0_g1_i1.p1  ORF type:complete len:405 (-),score=56.64 TRINITY_DN91129_c0_g1_i1:68-1282(-)